MRALITVNMDNDAFADTPATELARILRDLAKHVERGEDYRTLMDSNGNKVGAFRIEEKE